MHIPGLRFTTWALVVTAVLSAGCIGGNGEELEVTTRLVDLDGDATKDLEVLVALADGGGQKRFDGDGELLIERARGDHRTQALAYEPYARLDVVFAKDGEGWRDEQGGPVFVKEIDDHQLNSGYSYRIEVKVTGGGLRDATEFYYDRR